MNRLAPGTDSDCAARILELVRIAPTLWNSNSLTAWLIARSGIDPDGIEPPRGGRAPGWHAGLAVARRTEPSKH